MENNKFILNKTIPLISVSTHHKKLKGLFEFFDGFEIEDNTIIVELTVPHTPEIIEAIESVEIDLLPVPDVTPRQIRLALIQFGVSEEMILNAISQLPEPTRSVAKIEWEHSTAFQRNRPLVKAVGQMLNWNDAQLDALWANAKEIV